MLQGYFNNNIDGTKVLLKLMQFFQTNQIVYTSDAAVYGGTSDKTKIRYREDDVHEVPEDDWFGMTVFQAEKMIKMKAKTTMNFTAVSLRCFNSAGAHPSGILGQD